MNVRYRVTLTQYERDELWHAGVSDEDIAMNLGAGDSTVYRTKRRFVEGSLEAALSEEGAERKLSAKEEALLVATAPSSPPAGRARRPLELLADEMVELAAHECVSRETVRRRLAENDLKPWPKDMWCIPAVDADYVAPWRTCSTSLPKHPTRSGRWSVSTRARSSSSAKYASRSRQFERYDCEYRRAVPQSCRSARPSVARLEAHHPRCSHRCEISLASRWPNATMIAYHCATPPRINPIDAEILSPHRGTEG